MWQAEGMSDSRASSTDMRTIGIIGTGSMGQALISGWSSHDAAETGPQIVAVVRDSEKYAHLGSTYSVTVTEDREALLGCSVIVIAIKPQMIREILPEFASCVAPGTVIISVAAGITTDFIAQALPSTDQIIRAMPNTPSIIGKGMTGISGSPTCTRESLDLARELMSSVGAVVEVPESQQNALAAVSGSGPAYLFYLAQYLIEGAQELGLDLSTAQELVRHTLTGSAELLATSASTPEELRQQVTSPGGMTAAAMQVLNEAHVGPAVIAALVRGTERASELGATESVISEVGTHQRGTT